MHTANSKKISLNNPFLALRHPNFRLYFIGMIVSTIGTWMQNIAQPWLAYSLTDSPLLLGLVSALQFTPVLLFSLFSGVIIERFPKKKILLFTQSASLLITLTLAILVYSGHIRYWQIAVMATLLGFVNTLDMPTRQSFVIELAGKEDLMNAIALNSMTFNVARILGPGIAGAVMAATGTATCFLVNSISFGAVLVSLIFIKPPAFHKPPKTNHNVFVTIKEGLTYIRRHEILFVTLLIVAVVGTFAPNFSVLVPVFSREILMQKETGYGLLMSAMGLGSFFGALVIAMISKSGPKKYILYIVPLLVGAFLIVVGCTSLYLLTALSLAVTGFFFVLFSSNANSTMQLNTSDEYRGRVMSVYTLIFSGSTPIGNLFAGTMANQFNARVGFGACGAVILILMVPVYLYLLKKSGKDNLLA